LNNVQALEEEIVKLSAAELAELREWFDERDAASGKLDQLFEKPAPDQTVGQTNEPKHTEALDSGLLALYSEKRHHRPSHFGLAPPSNNALRPNPGRRR
jgi:hypothetical protein